MKYHLFTSTLCALAVVAASCAAVNASEKDRAEILRRAADIAPALADAPTYGAREKGRGFWDKLARTDSAKNAIKQAENYAKDKLPSLPESLYKEFYENGNRSHYQSAYGKLTRRLEIYTLAEMFENKGRFIEPLNEAILYFLDQPSWVLPAHDKNHTIYDGKDVYADLGSTLAAANLAIAVNLLGDKLPAKTVTLSKEKLEERILKPYRDAVAAEKPNAGMWWVRTENNWNAVCHAGTICVALNVVDSKEDRAYYLAGADYFSETRFMKGFTDDGYCSEGMGYWNYGVGNYMILGALARVATKGQLDLFRFPKMRAVLDYAPTLEIDNGTYAAFADCAMTAKPSPLYVGYLSRLKGYGYKDFERRGLDKNFGLTDSMSVCSFGFDEEVTFAGADENAQNPALPIRTDFPDARVTICRPDVDASGRYFAVAFKGGHNNEMHNHNDLGSYTLILGNAADKKAPSQFISRDPGGEVYTARTFSSRRYEGELLNSHGHPVPVVAGKLQSSGYKAQGKIVKKEFTDALDKVEIDIRTAYDVPTLKTLARTFEFTRAFGENSGSFRITDAAQFEEGKFETFETAIVTFSKPTIETNGNAVVIKIDDAVVTVSAKSADGTEQKIAAETTIVGEKDDSVTVKPTRIALKVEGSVNSTVVTQLFEVAK